MSSEPIGVLIAGIGCSSLGIEIFKALRYAGGYRLVGSDVSSDAFGMNEEGFEHTVCVNCRQDAEYAETLLALCKKYRLQAVAPGAIAVHDILSKYRELFEADGLLLMLNSEKTIEICSHKTKTLEHLKAQGLAVPETVSADAGTSLTGFDRYPCIVKPLGGGGSNLVFVAEDEKELLFFVDYIERRGFGVSIQEYIASEQEFTVGVLSDRDGKIMSSVALKRTLGPSVCYSMRYQDRVISSGWSMGVIDDFPEVRATAERIAEAVGSRWALNVQGRLGSDGVFYPFEINPRHSGTTFLRALAGFNEPDLLLQKYIRGVASTPGPLKPGNYLRAFREQYTPLSDRKQDRN